MKPGQPSETAIRVAINMAVAARDPKLQPLLSDPDGSLWEASVRAHGPEAEKRFKLRTAEKTAAFMRVVGDAIQPGGPLSLLLRKRYINDLMTEAVGTGVRQVVVLGAGYDSLSLRLLGRFPDLRCFEVDHPATQERKRRALAEHGSENPRLTFVPVDLAQQPPDEPLKAAGYDPAQKSAWLAEGVLMYLEPAVVDGVLEGVRRQSAPGSTLVFTMVDAGRAKEKGSTARATVALLQASSEPVLFTLDPETLGSWLAERGFTLRAKGDGEAMRVRYAEPLGLEGPASAGEWVVAAERA